MGEAHQRKKEPEQVRNALLECAARMTAEQGLAHVSLEAVARAAGVTKGGLLHHFPNKNALIEAMFEKMVTELDQLIDEYMDRDEMAFGRFTRAYVEAAFSDVSPDPADPWEALCMSSIIEPELQKRWSDWMVSRLKRHEATDNDPMLEIVRMAADGALFAFLTKAHNSEFIFDAPGLRARLLALTRQP